MDLPIGASASKDPGRLAVPLPPHVTPDVTILSFRTPGEARMIGYRSGETFHIIWFDWKFEVYDHGS